MLTRRRRSLAALLAAVSIVPHQLACSRRGSDAAALDAPDAPTAAGPPTVHAEMLAEHAGDVLEFSPA